MEKKLFIENPIQIGKIISFKKSGALGLSFYVANKIMKNCRPSSFPACFNKTAVDLSQNFLLKVSNIYIYSKSGNFN